jgi:hypothetical protein
VYVCRRPQRHLPNETDDSTSTHRSAARRTRQGCERRRLEAPRGTSGRHAVSLLVEPKDQQVQEVVTKRVVSGQRQGPPAKLLVCFTLPRRAGRLSFALGHFRSLRTSNATRPATRPRLLVSWISRSGRLHTHTSSADIALVMSVCRNSSLPEEKRSHGAHQYLPTLQIAREMWGEYMLGLAPTQFRAGAGQACVRAGGTGCR